MQPLLKPLDHFVHILLVLGNRTPLHERPDAARLEQSLSAQDKRQETLVLKSRLPLVRRLLAILLDFRVLSTLLVSQVESSSLP